MSLHRLQVEACKAPSCLYKKWQHGCFRSTFHQFISNAVNQGDAIYRLMFLHCETVTTTSIPVWRCSLRFYIAKYKQIEIVLCFNGFLQISFKVCNCVCLQILLLYLKRRKNEIIFYFFKRQWKSSKQFFIGLIQNCVLAYVCKVTNGTADLRM